MTRRMLDGSEAGVTLPPPHPTPPTSPASLPPLLMKYLKGRACLEGLVCYFVTSVRPLLSRRKRRETSPLPPHALSAMNGGGVCVCVGGGSSGGARGVCGAQHHWPLKASPGATSAGVTGVSFWLARAPVSPRPRGSGASMRTDNK